MAVIPRYWYVEDHVSGEVFKEPPGRIRGPSPNLVFDRQTGEVQREAVLMCALPWPRFRDFATGKQFVLPFGAAVAFERLESVFDTVEDEGHFRCGCDKPQRSGSHYRVEVIDAKRYALSFMCGRHFKISKYGGAGSPRHKPLGGREAAPSRAPEQPSNRAKPGDLNI